jgi:hypothetical protein
MVTGFPLDETVTDKLAVRNGGIHSRKSAIGAP